MSNYQTHNSNTESYDLHTDGDFPALARNNVQHSQSSSELHGNSYYGNHHQNKNLSSTADEWPTLDMNGSRQSQAFPLTSGSSFNSSTMDSFGINFKIAKKKNRKDKSKFKN